MRNTYIFPEFYNMNEIYKSEDNIENIPPSINDLKSNKRITTPLLRLFKPAILKYVHKKLSNILYTINNNIFTNIIKKYIVYSNRPAKFRHFFKKLSERIKEIDLITQLTLKNTSDISKIINEVSIR